MLRARSCSEPRRARSRSAPRRRSSGASRASESSSATFETSGAGPPTVRATSPSRRSRRQRSASRASAWHSPPSACPPCTPVRARRRRSWGVEELFDLFQHGGRIPRSRAFKYRAESEPAVWAGRPIFAVAGPSGVDVPAGHGNTGVRRARPRAWSSRSSPRSSSRGCQPPRPQAPSRAPSSRASIGRSPCPHVSLAASAAFALDLDTGEAVYSRNASLPLLPASNEKLAVTYAALTALGPSFTDRDRRPRQADSRSIRPGRANLVLKGYGDPTLSSARSHGAGTPGARVRASRV